MATRKGFEPSTSGVTGRRSNQLNYPAIEKNNFKLFEFSSPRMKNNYYR